MVDSSYFIGGYAIHGYASVPTFPASHGCVRVPVPNARSIYDWLRIGDRVDVTTSQAGTLVRRSCTKRTTIAPSPTAVAQRFTEPERTSPAA